MACGLETRCDLGWGAGSPPMEGFPPIHHPGHHGSQARRLPGPRLSCLPRQVFLKRMLPRGQEPGGLIGRGAAPATARATDGARQDEVTSCQLSPGDPVLC